MTPEQARAENKAKLEILEAIERSGKEVQKLVKAWNNAPEVIRNEVADSNIWRWDVENLKIAVENLVDFMHACWEREK